MTSRLRRKRRTILLPALTLASACWASAAESEPRVLPPLRSPAAETSRQKLLEVRQRTRALTQTSPIIRTQVTPEQIGPGDDAKLEEGYYFKVETKPPSRERLFTLGSEQFVLNEIESDFKSKDPGQVFLLPAPTDRFDINDAPILGPSWFQNRATGPRSPDQLQERAGEMRIKNQRGVFPVGAKPEAAVNTQTLGTSNMFVTVDIELGDAPSSFGLVFRAQDPNTWPGDVDQIKMNTFYFALMTEDTVMLAKSEKGVETVLVPAAKVSPKRAFNLAITAYENHIQVLRDGEIILEANDDSLKGDYVGMYGGVSVGQPTTFENFFAMRFGGPFQSRVFPATTEGFKAASVHYHPLYFHQLTVERYGQSMGNLVQPFISSVVFFGDFFTLPYSVGKTPPWVCLNDEGYAQPGDIVLPFRILCPTADAKGAALQTAFMVLSWSLIP